MAHSGEDSFEEIFKILVVRMFSEAELNGDWSFQKSVAEDATRKFNSILARAHKRWPGILDEDYATRLNPEHLIECLKVLDGAKLGGTDLEVLDHAFEFLVSQASKGSKGQYFTPRQVIECCVRVLDPKPTELIFDPACGSGGFIFHAFKHVARAERIEDTRSYSKTKLWGADFDARAAKVAKALLVLAGAEHANIFRVNSLLRKRAQAELGAIGNAAPGITLEDIFSTLIPRFSGFDVILTNPPFAGEIADPETLNAYALARAGRRIERDVLFIERCVELLKPGGRMAIVVPHNKVGAVAFAYLREWLVKRVRIVSVLGLDRATFLPHTHQKTSVLFCQKRTRTDGVSSPEDILFQISERSGKDAKGRLILRPGAAEDSTIWERADHDFEAVVETFQDFASRQSNLW